MTMKVGDVVKFQFGKDKKEGVVTKIFPKSIYLKVDFPRHKGKIIKRKIHTLEGSKKKK